MLVPVLPPRPVHSELARRDIELLGHETDHGVQDAGQVLGGKYAQHPYAAPLHRPPQPVRRSSLRPRGRQRLRVQTEELLQLTERGSGSEPAVAGDLIIREKFNWHDPERRAAEQRKQGESSTRNQDRLVVATGRSDPPRGPPPSRPPARPSSSRQAPLCMRKCQVRETERSWQQPETTKGAQFSRSPDATARENLHIDSVAKSHERWPPRGQLATGLRRAGQPGLSFEFIRRDANLPWTVS